MIVGRRLQEARKKLGYTQEQFGDLIGVGKSAICCYESETRNPTLDTVKEMVEVLGVTADYLLGLDVLVKDKIEKDKKIIYKTMTSEEIIFIDELRKDKLVYEILFEDPKRGSDLVKKKIG